MRINIYKQIRAFYSKVFNDEFDLSPTHISLYMFLLNQNNRTNWSEWFKVPFDTVMHGAAINSNKTYYKALNYLVECGLIKYEKGANNYKAPKISIVPLDQSENIVPAPEDSELEEKSSGVTNTPLTTHQLTLLTTNLSKHQCKQLDTHLSTQLSTNKDILLTGNWVITKREKGSETSSLSLSEKMAKFKEKCFEVGKELKASNDTIEAFFNYWAEHNENGNKMKCEKQKTFNTKMRMQTWLKNEREKPNSNKKQATNESEMLEYLYTHRKKENVDLAIQKRGVERVYKDVKEHNMIIDKHGELILL